MAPATSPPKDTLDILLDKLTRMREDLLTVERALERMQLEAAELTRRGDGSGKSRPILALDFP